MAPKSAYSILNVNKDASEEEIKRAYIELVKRYDPERHTDRFMVIQKAYERLTDPRQRAREDVFAFNAIAGKWYFTDAEREAASVEELKPQIEALTPRGEEAATDETLRRQLADLLMKRSCLLVKGRVWRDAIEDWKRVLKLDPTHHRARNNLGFAQIQLGYSYATHELYDEAASAWETALQLNPDNPKLIHNLALAHEESGQKASARKYWQELIRHWKNELDKSPDDPYLQERLVEVHKFQGDQAMGEPARTGKIEDAQTARREYTAALSIAPDDFKAQYSMAVTLMNDKKFKDACERLRTLNGKHPKNTEVLNLLGWAYLNSGEHERGFQTWRRSLAIEPGNQETKQNVIKARMQLAKSLRNKNQFTWALVHLKELQKLTPTSEEVQFEIAETFKLKGDKRSAEKEYRRVIQINPANKAATKALSEIRMGH